MVFTIYTAPLQSQPVRAWRQKSPKYRHGFVVRFFWIGLVIRIGRKPVSEDLDDIS